MKEKIKDTIDVVESRRWITIGETITKNAFDGYEQTENVRLICREARLLDGYLAALVDVDNEIKSAKTGREAGVALEKRANLMKTIAAHIGAKLI